MMPRYKTLDVKQSEEALAEIKGLEAIIVDDRLSAIVAGKLRIYASKDVLVISRQEPAP